MTRLNVAIGCIDHSQSEIWLKVVDRIFLALKQITFRKFGYD